PAARLLVEGILELLAGAEARLLGGLDGDLLAGLRIAALAAGARGHHEHAEAREADFLTRFERGGDQVEHALDRLGGGVLVDARVLGELLDEIILVHGDGSFARFAASQRSLGPVGSRRNRKTQGFGGKITK